MTAVVMCVEAATSWADVGFAAVFFGGPVAAFVVYRVTGGE